MTVFLWPVNRGLAVVSHFLQLLYSISILITNDVIQYVGKYLAQRGWLGGFTKNSKDKLHGDFNGTPVVDVAITPAALLQKDIKLCCPGGGIFFFWQLGACKRLAETLDMTQVQFVGYSSGSLVSVLCACGVDPQKAVAIAYDVALGAKIWDRPLGLAGIWGGLVRQWLEEVLPANAADLCSGRVNVVSTHLWSFTPTITNTFASKQELIDAVMSSVHVPIFMDWQPWTIRGGHKYVDGHLSVFLAGRTAMAQHMGWHDGEFLSVDHFGDLDRGMAVWEFLSLTDYNTVMKMVDAGYRFAKKSWC